MVIATDWAGHLLLVGGLALMVAGIWILVDDTYRRRERERRS